MRRINKMQRGATDYYEIEDSGCCLLCPDAHKGCLCFDCCCKKCYWYSSPGDNYDDNGSCDKVEELKEENREEWIRMKKEEQERANIEYEKKMKKEPIKKTLHKIYIESITEKVGKRGYHKEW
jgi:hypothetical protein